LGGDIHFSFSKDADVREIGAQLSGVLYELEGSAILSYFENLRPKQKEALNLEFQVSFIKIETLFVGFLREFLG
jgi:hypothetical protein